MMGGVIRNGLAISSRLCKLLDKLELKPIAAFENLHLPQTKDAIRNATLLRVNEKPVFIWLLI